MTEIALYVREGTAIIHHCVDVLARGGVIIYPTDTVYGLGCDATNPEAVARIRDIKGRVEDKPILAMVADLAMLEEYAFVTPVARALAEEFWPGPLSLVCEARGDMLASIQSRDGSVGFRAPDHSFCFNLVHAFGRPITSTSVNRSGMAQAVTVSSMLAQFGNYASEVDLVIDAGILPAKQPSTILDVRGSTPRILREGAILRDRLVRFGVV